MKKHLPFILIVTLFAFVGIKALFHPGLFTAHDIWHQVARLYHYHQAILDGQFPPYWISNLANGFGYPLFFFSPQLPWITALPLLSLGLDIPTTIKALFIISYILSGIFMYLFAHDLFRNRWAAATSAILYLWAPYHFVTILVSASMGTAFVFMFLPVVLWGIYSGGVLLIALGIAGSILSHLMTTISLIPLIGLFTIWSVLRKRSSFTPIKKVALGFSLGIGLSAFYLLPAVYYSQFTQVSTGAFSELYQKHFVNLSQLIYLKWGYGIADTAKEMNISFQIGIAQWIAIAMATVFIATFVIPAKAGIQKKIKDWIPGLARDDSNKIRRLVIFLLISFSLSIFLMLDTSRPLWDFANQFITLDFPTMFLLPATFAGSLLGGIIISLTHKNAQIFVAIIFITIALYTNRNHLRVNMYTDIPVTDYVAAEITTNSYHEYLPKTADIKLLSEPVTASLHHFSFPGVTLYVNGKRETHKVDIRGRITLPMDSDEHNLEVKFKETNLIKISKLITIATIVTILFIVWPRKSLKLLQ